MSARKILNNDSAYMSLLTPRATKHARGELEYVVQFRVMTLRAVKTLPSSVESEFTFILKGLRNHARTGTPRNSLPLSIFCERTLQHLGLDGSCGAGWEVSSRR